MGMVLYRHVITGEEVLVLELKWNTDSQTECLNLFAPGKAKRGLDGGIIINPYCVDRKVANTGSYFVKKENGEVEVYSPCNFMNLFINLESMDEEKEEVVPEVQSQLSSASDTAGMVDQNAAQMSQIVFDFGSAKKALEAGLCVARMGWNGKGMFVCKQVPAEIQINVVPNMQSLPDSAKRNIANLNIQSIKYMHQMVIINREGIINSWVPSVSDIFAEDYFVVD